MFIKFLRTKEPQKLSDSIIESGEFLSRLISWLLLDAVNVATIQNNTKNLIYNDAIIKTDPSATQTVTDNQGPRMLMTCRHEHAS